MAFIRRTNLINYFFVTTSLLVTGFTIIVLYPENYTAYFTYPKQIGYRMSNVKEFEMESKDNVISDLHVQKSIPRDGELINETDLQKSIRHDVDLIRSADSLKSTTQGGGLFERADLEKLTTQSLEGIEQPHLQKSITLDGGDIDETDLQKSTRQEGGLVEQPDLQKSTRQEGGLVEQPDLQKSMTWNGEPIQNSDLQKLMTQNRELIEKVHLEKLTTQAPRGIEQPDLQNLTTQDDQDIQHDNSQQPSLTGNIIPNISESIQNLTRPECLSRSNALWSQTPELLENSTGPSCSVMTNSQTTPWNDELWSLMKMSRRWTPPSPHNDSSLLNTLRNCTQFRNQFQFPTEPASNEEAEYPLAYVFMAHRNAAQTVRLFRMLYQPQNVYCIAYDAKGEKDYIRTILAMASCFPSNVYLNPKPEVILYADYSILRSVMNCMNVLHSSPINWKYIQIVSWNDFALKTNLEMVRIFKILNGSQDSELIGPDHYSPQFFVYKLGNRDGIRKQLPPGGITMYKGSFANAMSRDFIDFMFTNPISIKLYEYLNDTICPEEYYWTTLIHNIHLNSPGAFPGQCEVFYTNAGETKPFLSRFQIWEWDKPERKCRGEIVSSSCVYGAQDMPTLLERMELIAHKVYEEYEPGLMYCMEEWYWRKVCTGDGQLDWSFYEQLPSVKYHKLSKEEKAQFVCKL